jgi:hypothetical protein
MHTEDLELEKFEKSLESLVDLHNMMKASRTKAKMLAVIEKLLVIHNSLAVYSMCVEPTELREKGTITLVHVHADIW